MPLPLQTTAERIREIRRDTEARAREYGDAMMLTHSAAYVTFRYALERGWCTQAEHDDARAHYGNLWNYCGD